MMRSMQALCIVAALVWSAGAARAGERGEALFAAGCFWCVESAFMDLPGVTSVVSGYTGGSKVNPSYEQVSSGATGHAESVRVLYDPAKQSYAQLLDVFWHNVDPFSAGGQFCDRGSQYRSAIFYLDEAQRRAAEASRVAVEKRLKKGKVVTEVTAASAFYPAEAHHQKFCKTSPDRYQAYRKGCRRDQRLREIWGDEAPTH